MYVFFNVLCYYLNKRDRDTCVLNVPQPDTNKNK